MKNVLLIGISFLALQAQAMQEKTFNYDNSNKQSLAEFIESSCHVSYDSLSLVSTQELHPASAQFPGFDKVTVTTYQTPMGWDVTVTDYEPAVPTSQSCCSNIYTHSEISCTVY